MTHLDLLFVLGEGILGHTEGVGGVGQVGGWVSGQGDGCLGSGGEERLAGRAGMRDEDIHSSCGQTGFEQKIGLEQITIRKGTYWLRDS